MVRTPFFVKGECYGGYGDRVRVYIGNGILPY